jgi:hypothetical protein
VLPVSDSDCVADAGAVGSAASDADGDADDDAADEEDDEEELLQAAIAVAANTARAGSASAFNLVATVGYSFIAS